MVRVAGIVVDVCVTVVVEILPELADGVRPVGEGWVRGSLSTSVVESGVVYVEAVFSVGVELLVAVLEGGELVLIGKLEVMF